jgi:hypothetical protein
MKTTMNQNGINISIESRLISTDELIEMLIRMCANPQSKVEYDAMLDLCNHLARRGFDLSLVYSIVGHNHRYTTFDYKCTDDGPTLIVPCDAMGLAAALPANASKAAINAYPYPPEDIDEEENAETEEEEEEEEDEEEDENEDDEYDDEDNDEDDENEDFFPHNATCPYCGDWESCQHHMLQVDTTYAEATDGKLYGYQREIYDIISEGLFNALKGGYARALLKKAPFTDLIENNLNRPLTSPDDIGYSSYAVMAFIRHVLDSMNNVQSQRWDDEGGGPGGGSAYQDFHARDGEAAIPAILQAFRNAFNPPLK